MCSQYVSANVYPATIEYEIAKYNRYKDQQFQNITEADSVNIASIINSDPRYSELFSLHAALRFIDRFVDFESEISIEQQSKEKLDLLMHAINKAISNGVDIEVYQSKSKRGTIGAKVVIVPDKNTNLAAWKLSGSCPIELTITEHQPNYQHYDKNRNEPLIHTIFFKD